MIRKFRPEDADALVAVWRAASAHAHPFLSQDFLDREEVNMRDLHLPNAETWVVEADGAAIGFVALVGDEVGGLFLDPAHHGRGLGRALMARAIERGAMRVEVFSANAAARRFYAACGFRPVGEYLHEASGQPTLRLARD